MLEKKANSVYFIVDPERVPQAERVLFAFLSHVHVLVDAVSHLQNIRVRLERLGRTSSYNSFKLELWAVVPSVT